MTMQLVLVATVFTHKTQSIAFLVNKATYTLFVCASIINIFILVHLSKLKQICIAFRRDGKLQTMETSITYVSSAYTSDMRLKMVFSKILHCSKFNFPLDNFYNHSDNIFKVNYFKITQINILLLLALFQNDNHTFTGTFERRGLRT